MDFDDTCTVGDTIGHVVSATMAAQSPALVERKESLYKRLAREYLRERDELLDRLMDMQSSDTRGAAWLDEFLGHMSDFEVRRNDAVVESKLLHGATMESIVEASKRVVFREKCLETLHWATSSTQTSVAILSANWSTEFIRAAFEGHGAARDLDVGGISFIANSLEFDDTDNVTTGNMAIRICQTPNDKDRLLREVVGGGPYETSVYVGDSVGDVPALLGAHVGIVMGNNELLRRVLDRGEVQVQRVGRLSEGGGASRETRTVYQADSWEEVMRALGTF